MLRKPIKFEDLDGNLVEHVFYFNLTKSEVVELGLTSKEEDLDEYFQDIVRRKDTQQLINLFKDIISRSVGKRAEDGMLFIKDPAYTQAFLGSDAYSELFMSLFADEEEEGAAMQAFMNGILPSSMTKDLNGISAADLKSVVDGEKSIREISSSNVTPLTTRGGHLEATAAKVADAPKKPEQYTRDELLEMSDEDFVKICGSDPQKMDRQILTLAFERRSRAQQNPQT